MWLRKIVGICLFSLAWLTCIAETFDSRFASLEVDANGKVISLREKPSGRELGGGATPMMTVVLNSMKRGASESFRKVDAGRYAVGFKGIAGKVILEIKDFGGGWTFCVERADIPQLHALIFFDLKPVCKTYVGRRVNGLSDDSSGVVLRAYRTDGEYTFPGQSLSITYRSARSFAGAAVGLAAGRREEIPGILRAMTIAAGVPHSDSGGAWSLDSEMNRYSYLIADDAAVDTMDDLLEIAERTGVSRFHFRRFWDQPGWYGIDTNKYPRGIDDLKDCSAKAKAAGLKTSIHNLSGCIGRDSPWMSTEMADGIRVRHRYTLAEPIPEEGEVSEIRVNEKPATDHGFDFSGRSRGNTIRIGTELFQYSDISFEPPYAFKNVQRACFGSKSAAHAAGTNADYLWCFFGSFLVEPGTPLAMASAKRYADVYKAGDFDGIYNDGLDGYHDAPSFTRFMFDFYKACADTGKPPHFEDSMWTTGGWWIHSMVGSWDYASWSPKTFTDRHVANGLVSHRLANYQQMTLGWWPVVIGYSQTFGYMRDDVEYFAAKIAGHDSSFSLIPNYYRGHVQNYAMIGQQVVLGWYERFRVARAFRQCHLDAFRTKGADFRLEQGVDGVWRVRATKVSKHHMVSPIDNAWTVQSPAALPAALRIRALDSGEKWDGRRTLTVLSASMVTNLSVRSEKGVEASVTASSGEHGATLMMMATNNGAETDNSWSVVERTIPRPFLDLWGGKRKLAEVGVVPNSDYEYLAPKGSPLAIGAWIKGDGSGVDVNLQLHSPATVNGAYSDHHVTLDFTGWRYFIFSIWRDHRPEVTERYRWPYLSDSAYSIYEVAAACQAIENVSVWMNGLKPGQTATVEVSDVRVMPETHPTLSRAVVMLNGTRCEVPFDIACGQYAELEDGDWTLYSLSGVPLNRQKAKSVPQLVKGNNAVKFECSDAAMRAQVTITALGPDETALVPNLNSASKKILLVESEYPRFYAPARNMADLAPMAMRPGERAMISFTLIGPIDHPTICVGGKTVSVGRSLGKNDLIRGCFDGVFSGSVPVSMTCDNPKSAAATLMLVKRYVDEQSRSAPFPQKVDVPERHKPKSFMGRNFWRVLYKYGDWACGFNWATPARRVRFDNREIYDCPAFKDVVWSYFGRNPPPDPSTGKSVWRSLRDNFQAQEPDREILDTNPDPDRPFYMSLTGRRNLIAWAGDVDLDYSEYSTFLRSHPNLVYDGWNAEWCNDVLLAYSRVKAMPASRRKDELRELLGTSPPRNRPELVETLRRYFNRQREVAYGGRMCLLDAHLNSFHMALDFGAHMISLETTDSSGNGTTADENAYFPNSRMSTGAIDDANDNSSYRWNVSAMFARGASRQFGTLWEWYIAGYTNGWTEDGVWRNNVVCVYPENDSAVSLNDSARSEGPEYGQSTSNLRRAHYFAYLNGPTFVNMEEWSSQFTMWDVNAKKTVLSPRGRMYVEFADFTRRHPDRGAVYTPVAICVPVAQGYPTWGGYPWGLKRCGYTCGDAMVDAVFYTLVPGFERAREHRNGVEYNLVNSPYAQMYDVISPDITRQGAEELLAVLRSYKAVVVAGDYPDRKFERTLVQYESEGGRVIRLSNKEVPAVDETQLNDLKGGKIRFPEVARIFAGLQDEYFPLKVSGDVCYGMNCMPDGWWLWAFNSKGVVKFVNKPEKIDNSFDTTLSVTFPGDCILSVREIVGEREVVMSGRSFTDVVPAGDLRIYEIRRPKFSQCSTNGS